MKKAVLFLSLILAFVAGCGCPSKVPAPVPKPAPVLGPGPKPVPVPGPKPVPVPPDRLAREVNTGFGAIISLKDNLSRMIEEIGQLKTQDCRDGLREFREDRTSPSNLMTRMTSAGRN